MIRLADPSAREKLIDEPFVRQELLKISFSFRRRKAGDSQPSIEQRHRAAFDRPLPLIQAASILAATIPHDSRSASLLNRGLLGKPWQPYGQLLAPIVRLWREREECP